MWRRDLSLMNLIQSCAAHGHPSVIVVIIIGGAGARTLDAAGLACGAIADRMRVFKLGRRRLVVLISDVGHFCCLLF